MQLHPITQTARASRPHRRAIPWALTLCSALLCVGCTPPQPSDYTKSPRSASQKQTESFTYGEVDSAGSLRVYSRDSVDQLAPGVHDDEAAFYSAFIGRYKAISRDYEAALSSLQIAGTTLRTESADRTLPCSKTDLPPGERAVAVPLDRLDRRLTSQDARNLRHDLTSKDGSWSLYGVTFCDGDKLFVPYLHQLASPGPESRLPRSHSDSIVIERYQNGVRVYVATVRDSGRTGQLDQVTFSHPYKPAYHFYEDGHLRSIGISGYSLMQDRRLERIVFYKPDALGSLNVASQFAVTFRREGQSSKAPLIDYADRLSSLLIAVAATLRDQS